MAKETKDDYDDFDDDPQFNEDEEEDDGEEDAPHGITSQKRKQQILKELEENEQDDDEEEEEEKPQRPKVGRPPKMMPISKPQVQRHAEQEEAASRPKEMREVAPAVEKKITGERYQAFALPQRMGIFDKVTNEPVIEGSNMEEVVLSTLIDILNRLNHIEESL